MTSFIHHAKNSDHVYLFDSLSFKPPGSSRKVHIRRLVDFLQLSIHRRDWPRAKRAWCILARCQEFEWKKMWQTGLLLTSKVDDAVELDGENDQRPLEYLRVMMLRAPENRVDILQEIILWLIKADQHQEALEELELYLPSFPYQDSPVLHIYAGLLCLFLARPRRDDAVPLKQSYIRECKSHLRRASDLDSENPVSRELLLGLDGTPDAAEQDTGDESENVSDAMADLNSSDDESAASK